MNEKTTIRKPMGRPKKKLEVEERARREIANSNERRRMKSINNGFHCLRQILIKHNNIEKHSKAEILRESANYIIKLEQDINYFTEQNQILKNFIDNYKNLDSAQQNNSDNRDNNRIYREEDLFIPLKKRIKSSIGIPNKSNLRHNFSTNGNHLPQYEYQLTNNLKTEVSELMTLLGREQRLRYGINDSQKSADLSHLFNPISVKNYSHLSLPTNEDQKNSFITHLKSMPTQLSNLCLRDNYEEKPLNLIISKNLTNDFENPNNGFNELNKKFNLFGNSSMNNNLNFDTQLINKGIECKINSKMSPVQFSKCKNSIPSEENIRNIGLKQKIASNKSLINSNIEIMRSMNSSKEIPKSAPNLQLILEAIQHKEGNDFLKARYQSNNSKELMSNTIIHKNQYLRKLLNEEFCDTSNEKTRPTIHSIDSLI